MLPSYSKERAGPCARDQHSPRSSGEEHSTRLTQHKQDESSSSPPALKPRKPDNLYNHKISVLLHLHNRPNLSFPVS